MRKKSFRISIQLAEYDAVAIVFDEVMAKVISGESPNKITQKYCRDCIMRQLNSYGLSTIDDVGYYMGMVLDDHDDKQYETIVDIARQIEEQVHKIYKNK